MTGTESLKIAVVVDALCDLPRSYVDYYDVQVLPIDIEVDGDAFSDTRHAEKTKSFYLGHLTRTPKKVALKAPSIEETKRFFMSDLVTRYDRVLVLTASSVRAQIYENATKASFSIVKDQRSVRTQAGLTGSFAVRVVDTQSLFSGEAILAHEAVRLITEESFPFDRLRTNLVGLSKHVHSYVVPKRLRSLYNNRRARSDMSLMRLWTGRAFDIKPVIEVRSGEFKIIKRSVGYNHSLEYVFAQARRSIDDGLMKPLVAMSYAGEPREMLERDEYQDFADYAQSQDVELLLSVMSATGGTLVGPGAFSLSYAA